MDETRIDLAARFRDRGGRRAVDRHGPLGVCFSLIDSGVCGSIDDGMRMALDHGVAHRLQIGEVALRTVAGEQLNANIVTKSEREFPSYLAARSEEQHLHLRIDLRDP
jgi:hypothetical protein